MASSSAATVAEYLDELPADRRAVVAEVRDLVRRSLPREFEEGMNWGMIAWEIPRSRYPDTYNDQPLAVAALAAQKNYFALYLHALYMDADRLKRFEKAFRDSGKKLDMGKSCVRFKRIQDLDLDAIASALADTTPEDLISLYESRRT